MTLSPVVDDYRRMVTERGVPYVAGPPATPEELARTERFHNRSLPDDVRTIYELHNGTERVFPGGFFLTPLPTTIEEAMDTTACAYGAPFGMRDHRPLFRADVFVLSVVLAGDRRGEVWFYEISPDENNLVVVADSLTALFGNWNRLLADDVLTVDDRRQVVVDETEAAVDRVLTYLPDINPMSVIPDEMLSMDPALHLRPWQRAAGVHRAIWDDDLDEYPLFEAALAEQQRIVSSFS